MPSNQVQTTSVISLWDTTSKLSVSEEKHTKQTNQDSSIYILVHISEIKLCKCNSLVATVISPPTISGTLLEGLVEKFCGYINIYWISFLSRNKYFFSHTLPLSTYYSWYYVRFCELQLLLSIQLSKDSSTKYIYVMFSFFVLALGLFVYFPNFFPKENVLCKKIYF